MKEIFQVLGIFSMFISALVGFFFWLIQRNINQRDAEEQRRRTAGSRSWIRESRCGISMNSIC